MGLFDKIGLFFDVLFDFSEKEKNEEQLQEEKEEKKREEQNKWFSKELYYSLGLLSHPDGGDLRIDEVDVSIWDNSKEASAYVSVTLKIDIPEDIRDDYDEVLDFKTHTENDYTNSYGVDRMEEYVEGKLENILSYQKKYGYKVSASISISFEFSPM